MRLPVALRDTVLKTAYNTNTHHPQFQLRIFTAVRSTPSLSRTHLHGRRSILQRLEHYHNTGIMSSDQQYMDFLNKANSDVGGSNAQTFKNQQASSNSVNTEVPPELRKIDATFTSDADEPFEPVALKWSGDSLPSADDLAKLTETSGKVTSISEKDFDPRGEYSTVTKQVKSVGKGQVAFFRVELTSTRSEYYILTVAEQGVVGVKAKAYES